MAEGRSRSASRTPRERSRPAEEVVVEESRVEPNGDESVVAPEAPPGADDESHDRYEEIKRGELHLSELQRMTMQQLLVTAKREGVQDYSGLKKQDLIF